LEELDKLMEELPADLQQEVIDFAKFLLHTKHQPTQRKLRLNWAGGLRDFRDKFTSLNVTVQVG